MTHRPIAATALALIAGAFVLGGCSSKQSSVWASHFNATHGIEVGSVGGTKIIPAPYDQIEEDANIDGWVIVGTSRFRDEKIPSEAMGKDSALEAQALSVGADLVRVGIRPAGEEMRTRYVRTGTPASVPDQATRTGRPVSGTSSGSMPVEYPVKVYDYFAVFYHKTS